LRRRLDVRWWFHGLVVFPNEVYHRGFENQPAFGAVYRVRPSRAQGRRFLFVSKVISRRGRMAASSRKIRRLPTSLRRSLTWDHGLEPAKHKSFTAARNLKVYFCDPHRPWRRGTNENTNRLPRQYLPKRTALSNCKQSQSDKIALRLTECPRKTVGRDFARGIRSPANRRWAAPRARRSAQRISR
jgi:hypothetical protein